jgi:hypothetical protein
MAVVTLTLEFQDKMKTYRFGKQRGWRRTERLKEREKEREREREKSERSK